MLYVTTRVEGDAFTIHRALTSDRGPQGGFFVPMTVPELDLEAMYSMTFGHRVAAVLNALFNTRLDGWDVEFAIGRFPVRLMPLGSRITLAETWHNPDWKFIRVMKSLERMVRNGAESPADSGQWMAVAVRIALLFGIVPDLGSTPVDIALPEGDFSGPMAAWYARQWGLPIGNIIVCCGENSGLWSLTHQGEVRGQAPEGLERLIFCTMGSDMARQFAADPTGFRLCEKQVQALRGAIHTQVVSRKRTEDMLRSIYKTTQHVPEPDAAMAYSGLMGYRSKTTERWQGLILSENAPFFQREAIAGSLGISASHLDRLLDRL